LLAALALAGANGCNKADVAAADGGLLDGATAGQSPGALAAADAAVAEVYPPPPPLIAADPNIPVHEALVGAQPVIRPDSAVPLAPAAPGAGASAAPSAAAQATAPTASAPGTPAGSAQPTDAPIAADTAMLLAPQAPPAPATEQPPPSPEAGDTWIPGYWWWSPPLARFVWVSGTWRHSPPNEAWTPGMWVPDGAQYAWLPGFWATPGAPAVTVAAPPPALQAEVTPPSPGVGFDWTPGFYDYRGGSYVWVGGSWARPPSAGLAWVAPCYVGPPGHLRFQPGRWDFPPERRGFAYRPDIDVRPGERVRFAALPRDVVVEHAHYNFAEAHAMATGHRFAVGHPGEDHARFAGPGAAGEFHGEGHGPAGGHFGGEGHAEAHPGPGGHEGFEGHGPEGHPGGEGRGGPGPQPHGGGFGGGPSHGPGPGPGPSHGGGNNKRR
jgi:hypothetical protein